MMDVMPRLNIGSRRRTPDEEVWFKGTRKVWLKRKLEQDRLETEWLRRHVDFRRQTRLSTLRLRNRSVKSKVVNGGTGTDTPRRPKNVRMKPVKIQIINGSEYYGWKKVINCVATARNNVLQFPQQIIRKCIPPIYQRVVIKDFDTKKAYKGTLLYSKRKYNVERSIGKEWYEYVKDRKLVDGDELVICVRDKTSEYLEADELLVAVKVLNK